MNEKGLYVKYEVRKKDTDELVENCFVLRPDKDFNAIKALRTYASETSNQALSLELTYWLDELEQNYEYAGTCSYCGEDAEKVRPSPYMADYKSNACKHCWEVSRDRGKIVEGIDIGEFDDYPHWKGEG
jgi:hypothetical protein